MATLTSTNTTVGARPFRLPRPTREGVVSVVFLVLAIVLGLVVTNPDSVQPVTQATLGANLARVLGRPAVLSIPVGPWLVVVGGLLGVGGVVGLLPNVPLRVKRLLLIAGGAAIIPTIVVLAGAGRSFNLVTLLQASLRLATPIILGAMAGIWCERSGVVNIAIEGMMLTGAAVGFITFSLLASGGSAVGNSQFVGIVAAVLAGGVMSALHAWLSITYRTDQIVSGTVINILAVGVTSFLRREVLLSSQAGRETLPLLQVPVLGNVPILGEVLFTGRPIFFSMLVIVVLTHVVLFYTQWGLRTRAVGENPHAADTLGIRVIRNRWINVLIGGLIAGLAGAWFSLETAGSFDDNMTGGKGFIALAAMIFGKWTPFGAAAGGLLFGFSDALGSLFQILSVPVPHQFVQMTPYIVTIVVLAGLVGRATAPRAVGTPYRKE